MSAEFWAWLVLTAVTTLAAWLATGPGTAIANAAVWLVAGFALSLLIGGGGNRRP